MQLNVLYECLLTYYKMRWKIESHIEENSTEHYHFCHLP